MGGRKQSKHYASHENIGADFPIQSRSLYIRTAATAAAPRVENKLSCLLASLHHRAAEPNSLWHHVSSTAAPSQTSDRPSACDSSPKPCRILSPHTIVHPSTETSVRTTTSICIVLFLSSTFRLFYAFLLCASRLLITRGWMRFMGGQHSLPFPMLAGN